MAHRAAPVPFRRGCCGLRPGACSVSGSAYGQRMVDQRPPLSSVSDFVTWEPVLRLMLADDTERRAARSARVAGRIGQYGTSLAHRGPMSSTARTAVKDIQRALAHGRVQEIAFRAEVHPDGRATLGLVWPTPVVEPARGYPDLGVLILADSFLPEPWRRRPDPAFRAVPAPSANPELLERTLRERLPDSIGATEEEIAAAEARLGVTLSDEIKVLYRVTRVYSGEDFDFEEADRAGEAIGCEASGLEHLRSVDGTVRHPGWDLGAKRAVSGGPDAAVQSLTLFRRRWQSAARCWCRRRQCDQRSACAGSVSRQGRGRTKTRSRARSSRGLTGTMTG